MGVGMANNGMTLCFIHLGIIYWGKLTYWRQSCGGQGGRRILSLERVACLPLAAMDSMSANAPLLARGSHGSLPLF